MNDKKIIKGKIRILSPVHIGGAAEKHAQKGLDFIDKNGTVFFLDEKKMIAHFGIEKYSNALAYNKLAELCGSIKLSEYSSKVISSIYGEVGTDIKIAIKNPLSNKPIIPGSSLKGAIRSVFVNKLGGAETIERFGKKQTIEPFGQIHEDINRYMIAGDTEFSSTTFINTKTFNLYRDPKGIIGGWKHSGYTSDRFDSKGFTFPHEVIDVNDFADFHLVFNIKALENARTYQKGIERNYDGRGSKKSVLKTNQVIDYLYSGSQTDFFNVLKDYSANFFKKEIEFFTKFEAEYSENIIEYYRYLIEENEKMPVLRIGLGSGFHSMTSDTFESHGIDEINKRGKYRGRDSAKSRKIAFSGNGEDLKLYPMGFIQLMTEQFYNINHKKAHEKRVESSAMAQIKALKQAEENAKLFELELQRIGEKEKIRAEEERIAAEEALKPKMVDVSQLKKAIYIDAIVTGQNGKNITFKPYVKGFENQIFEIRYPAGLPMDTIIQILCQKTGKTLQFQGSPKLK